MLKYTGDCVLTQYVILPLTFVSWRSMLTLYDILLSADEDPLTADIVSACIGLGLCSICFAIEVPLAKVARLSTLSIRVSSVGPIPWGHSGPLCHALSLSSS